MGQGRAAAGHQQARRQEDDGRELSQRAHGRETRTRLIFCLGRKIRK
ncbi:unnamed protein product [[Actinomadura] parvosata subsp. kistnae]|nr:unnamed protein product [Actinomadura parvosata subsp. kistnae]